MVGQSLAEPIITATFALKGVSPVPATGLVVGRSAARAGEPLKIKARAGEPTKIRGAII